MNGFFELVVRGGHFLAQVARFEPQTNRSHADTPMEVPSSALCPSRSTDLRSVVVRIQNWSTA